jgi:hypothetical protein
MLACPPVAMLIRLKRTAGMHRSLQAMPWNELRYPASMRHPAPEVRAKAIEIANALLDEGMDEGRAIRIAIAKAKEWVERHGEPVPWDGRR